MANRFETARDRSGAVAARGNENGHADMNGRAGMIQCASCGHHEPPARKFCAKCGESLWMTCHKCGSNCAAGERFCGQCGADLGREIAGRLAEIEAAFARSEELRAAGDYEQSIARLAPVMREKHVRLAPQVARARERIAELRRERQDEEDRVANVLEEANELYRQKSFERAAALMEGVRPPLRSEEFTVLLERLHLRGREAVTLSGEIRDAIARKEALHLMPKLTRLLELQPDNEQAKKLIEQLAGRLIGAANKKLAAHAYDDALDLLERLPESHRSDKIKSQLEQLTELAWLFFDLRTSPVVDPVLCEVGRRLTKRAASNQIAVQRAKQLEQRSKLRPKDPRQAAIAWAALPQSPRVGCRLEWLGRFGPELHGEALLSREYDENPGCFFTAFGLALGGLGAGKLQIDLGGARAKKRGFSLFGKKKIQTAWGIDLGDEALTAIKLFRSEGGGVVIQACERISLERNLSRPDAVLMKERVLERAIAELKARHDLTQADRVCAGFPTGDVIGRFFRLPPVESRRVADVVTLEAGHQLPMKLEELAWGFGVIATDEEVEALADDEDIDPDTLPMIVLQAARQEEADARIALFTRHEIPFDFLHSDSTALYNFARYLLDREEFADDEGRRAIALVDVGSAATSVVIAGPKVAWFRSFRLGGVDFTRTLVKEMHLNWKDAEQLKRDPREFPLLSRLDGLFQPHFEQLLVEIDRSIARFHDAYPDGIIHRMYGLGGGFALHGLYRFLIHGPPPFSAARDKDPQEAA